MANITLNVSTSETKQNVRNWLSFGSKHLSTFLGKIGSLPSPTCSIQVLNDDSVAASATLTMAFASQTDGDTIQIGAMTLTAKTSGASTNQFNIGASNTASATNLALAINTYSSNLITATSAAGVVTVRAASTGTLGNAIPVILTQSSAGIVASATSLSGGLADTGVTIATRSF